MMNMMIMMMMMMMAKSRWADELTFSFVTQGVYGTPCLMWRTELRKAMRSASTAAPCRPFFFGKRSRVAISFCVPR